MVEQGLPLVKPVIVIRTLVEKGKQTILQTLNKKRILAAGRCFCLKQFPDSRRLKYPHMLVFVKVLSRPKGHKVPLENK